MKWTYQVLKATPPDWLAQAVATISELMSYDNDKMKQVRRRSKRRGAYKHVNSDED